MDRALLDLDGHTDVVTAKYANILSLLQTSPDAPMFCFSRYRLNKTAREFLSRFPGIVSWSVKSNPQREILQCLHQAGIRHFDVSSRSEIDFVKSNIENPTLHFNNPIKSHSDIRYAMDIGVSSYAIDDLNELDKIEQIFIASARHDRAAISLNIRFRIPEVSRHSIYEFSKKFGATIEEAAVLMTRAVSLGYEVSLTCHPGSQTTTPDAYAQIVQSAAVVRELSGVIPPDKRLMLNVGGGFPSRHYPGGDVPLGDYFKKITGAVIPGQWELMCEPGRALVADCANILTRVNLRKADHRIYLNDGIYGSFMELPVMRFVPKVRVYSAKGRLTDALAGATALFQVFGPTCDSLDQFPVEVALPETIGTGDYIEFIGMGAYSLATSTHFNGFSPAALVEIEMLDSLLEAPASLVPVA